MAGYSLMAPGFALGPHADSDKPHGYDNTWHLGLDVPLTVLPPPPPPFWLVG